MKVGEYIHIYSFEQTEQLFSLTIRKVIICRIRRDANIICNYSGGKIIVKPTAIVQENIYDFILQKIESASNIKDDDIYFSKLIHRNKEYGRDVIRVVILSAREDSTFLFADNKCRTKKRAIAVVVDVLKKYRKLDAKKSTKLQFDDII